MNTIKNIFWGGLLFVTAVSCSKEQDPQGLKNAATGAYMRDINISSNTFSIANLSDAYFEITIEEWDEQQGGLFDSYDFNGEFHDNTPDNGTITPTKTLVKKVPATAFARDTESGLLRATVRITAAETMAALNMTVADIAVGDQFRFVEDLHLTDGRIFNDLNSANGLTSTWFKAPMFHNVNVVD